MDNSRLHLDESVLNYQKLSLLTSELRTVSDAHQFVSAFFQMKPHEDLNSTIFASVVDSIVQSSRGAAQA